MAALTTLTPNIQAEIPEVPTFIASHQLLRAIREFCEETRAWRVDVVLAVVAATPVVALTTLLPTDTELVDIITIKNVDGGEPLEPRTMSWLDTNISDWRTQTEIDARWYLREAAGSLRLVPFPSSTISGKYFVRVAIKPILADATTVDDIILSRYDEVLTSGALARLYMTPRKPWTDLNLGQYHRAKFEMSWPGARTSAADEHQTGIPRKVKYGGI